MQEQTQNTSEETLLEEFVDDKSTLTTKEALYKLLESQSDCV